MRKKADPALVGAFVLGGLALVVAAVLLWGSGRLFRETPRCVCYFEGSVDGLDVGAPVKARGMVIGRVYRMQLRYRQRDDDNRIPIFLEVDVKRLVELGGERPRPETIREMIARGLRARLESQSLITGTLFVNMGLFPDTPVKLSEVDPADGYPEIPTVPTQLAEVGKSVTAILARLETVDLAGMASSIDRAASSIERLTSSEKVSEALARVSTTLGSYEKLGRHLDEGLRPVVSDLQAAIADARKTLLALNGVTGDARRLVAPDAAVSVRLGEALNEVGRAASAIRELADYLQRNPNALLVGKSR
jgi:paraquat-inducible protein B